MRRSNDFKEDASTWKGNDDGKVGNGAPQRQVDMNGVPAYGGYIAK